MASLIPNLEARVQTDQLLVVFDGHCGLCNRTVRWLLRRDRRDKLRFAPSTDPAIAELLSNHGISVAPDTILVLRNINTPIEELLVRSNAILVCLRALPQPWRVLAAIARLIPRPFREAMYRLVAQHRYQIWGRYESCPFPTADERRHFL
ncbi:thiol-disulfide oxidoreductase DCC family protein [Acidicapsa ligni]|uniref:thiol-disulfide oxidoreductase DCC family protein n=1 Tax=Acidicapsa ligni TaxID=542300 RepID=UPI0021DF819C|nr:DCC1-like thiol-disulfide oxidoreductase family protein [Acidicapsa ligni]